MSHVLVIVHDPVMCDFVKLNLEEQGHNVITANNESTMVEQAKKQQTDLAIIDLNMPDMVGIKLASALREIDGYKTIPILMLIEKISADKRAECRKADVSSWLRKPFVELQLIISVNTLLNH